MYQATQNCIHLAKWLWLFSCNDGAHLVRAHDQWNGNCFEIVNVMREYWCIWWTWIRLKDDRHNNEMNLFSFNRLQFARSAFLFVRWSLIIIIVVAVADVSICIATVVNNNKAFSTGLIEKKLLLGQTAEERKLYKKKSKKKQKSQAKKNIWQNEWIFLLQTDVIDHFSLHNSISHHLVYMHKQTKGKTFSYALRT